MLLGSCGSVSILGTGKVQLVGTDYTTNLFRTSAQSGGSGADEVARAAVAAHESNATVHVTADEKKSWNTVNYSNPNLLINPDFKINQRGLTEYSVRNAYTADHWKIGTDVAQVTPTDNGLKVGVLSDASAGAALVMQNIENYSDFNGQTCTLSVNVSELSAIGARIFVRVNDSNGTAKYPASLKLSSAGISSVTFDVPDEISLLSVWLFGADTRVTGETADSYTVFRWVKLEIGSVATQFVPPDPASELAKCQRYYQIHSTNDIAEADMRPSMATRKSVTAVTGGYAYDAEL
jgi:hypothetical protein